MYYQHSKKKNRQHALFPVLEALLISNQYDMQTNHYQYHSLRQESTTTAEILTF